MKKVHIIAIVSVVIAVIAALGGAWYLMLAPINEKIEIRQKELAAVRAELKKAEAAASQHEKFQAEAENVTRNLAFVKSRLEGSFTENDIYQVFNHLGSTEGVDAYKYSRLKSTKYKDAKTLMEHGVEVEFVSTFHELGEFLNKSVSMQRIIVLQTVSVESADETGKLALAGGVNRSYKSLKTTLTFNLYAKAPAKKKGK